MKTRLYPRRAGLGWLIALMLIVAACDTLEVEPKQSVSPDVALNSTSGFEALIVSAYNRLQDVSAYQQAYVVGPEVLADNMDLTTTNTNRFVNELLNASGAHLTRYGGSYAAINEANLVIANIDAHEEVQSVKDRIEGEARFLRALNYFDLVKIYGYMPGREPTSGGGAGFTDGVILRLTPTTDQSEADDRARATHVEIYEQIEADLLEAIALLEGQPLPKWRASHAAAQALLARVYLYWSRWDAAAQMATDALASSPAPLAPDSATYVGGFRAASHPESIFEINFEDSEVNTNEVLSIHTIPVSGFGGDFIVTDDLFNAHEPGDARLGNYVSADVGGERVHYVLKYLGAKGTFADNVPILRVSELYLTRAEAYAELGDDDLARADLNTIRSRLTLPDVPATLSGQALIDAILTERRLELVFEGHRFFDLKRRGLDIPKPQIANPDLAFTDFRVLAPLPTNEVDLNELLRQNPGY